MTKQAKIVIYGTEHCSYCTAARMLLKKKNLHYEDILVSHDPELLGEMQRRSGRRSVPQVFVGDISVGGFDELYALEQSGDLDRVLAEQLAATVE
jgi:glutaredoxin 3